MINNNKILTVSYGTFSCTLEGFDDSFGTMKAIAEYFRDLASDDRYFGAEPPQPDAQMLARIAQREMSRHVEAREDEGRIVLSAHDAPKAAALVAKQAVDEAAVDLPDTDVVQADQDEPEYADTEVEDLTDDADNAVEDAVEAVEEVVQHEVAEIEIAPEEAEPETADVEDAPVVDEPDIVPSLPDAEVEAFFADSTDTNTVEDEVMEVQPAAAQVRADSIADKLKRIRAVVSQQPDEDAAPDYSEDQHADGNNAASAAAVMTDVADVDTDEESDVLADTLRDIEDALDEDDAYDIPTADEALDDEESEDDDISAILSRLEADAEDEDAAPAPAELDEDDTFDDDFDADDLSDNIMAAMGKGEAADAAPDAENLFEDQQEQEPAQVAAPKVTVTPKPAAPRTRVLKVKRATLEAAIQAGQLEEYDDDTPAASGPTSSLSDEAEEELARELAELEADIQADEQDDFDDGYDDVDDTPELDAAMDDAKAPRAQLDETADDSFSRLMEETEQQMEEPEGSNRRDAFAHLRAAVAAKKADEAVGGIDEAIESDEAYRDDLASVVRPRRPASTDRTRTERPSEQRPAPLKLVAEQRIDTAEPRRVTPVRPRRVAAAAAPAPETDMPEIEGSFADFASDMGATQLPDLLEAAAAYLSFVEGHAEFSRPQLMTKVRQVEKENFTREDGLRSFGKLLREGKIEKLRGGRFQASEQIGFKPDARAAS